MEILYKPTFIRQFNKLEELLQNEVLEKIELFKDKKNNKLLKVHKLHGRLAKHYSFSVNYSYRIVFNYLTKDKAVLFTIGDHDIYK